MNKEQDKQYWIERHKKFPNSLRSVGHQRFNEKANSYIYKQVRQQYQYILDKLNIPESTRVIDTGTGTGQYLDILLKKGWSVTATDISSEAVNFVQKNFPKVNTLVGGLSDLHYDDQNFELVQCFDVLYHILKKEEWERSIKTLCRISNKYVIIHGIFLNDDSSLSAWHVRHRSTDQINKVFKSQGFNEIISVPTHVTAMKFPLIYLRNFVPGIFFWIDNWLIRNNTRKGTYFIKVYKRTD